MAGLDLRQLVAPVLDLVFVRQSFEDHRAPHGERVRAVPNLEGVPVIGADLWLLVAAHPDHGTSHQLQLALDRT